MSKGDLYALYWKTLNELLDLFGVEHRRRMALKEVHTALKEYFDIESISKARLPYTDLHLYVSKVLMLLAREYGIGSGELKL